MKQTALLALARRQLRTQLRTTEWRALLSSTLIAITLATLLTLISDHLERALLKQSSALLGSDITLVGSGPLNPVFEETASKLGLQHSNVVQFPTMISPVSDNDDAPMMLVSVRAASAPYPLRGRIETSTGLENSTAKKLPSPGQVWVEPRVLDQLGLQPGEQIEVGYITLTVAAVMQSSPDRGTGFRSFNPQILMNAADLKAAKVLTTGSRAKYRLLLAGSDDAITQFQQQLETLPHDYDRVLSVRSDQPIVGGALGQGLSYLKLSALAALAICALTILFSLRRFSQRQQTRSALLLSLGLRPRQLVCLYSYQLLMAWTLLAVAGTLLAAGLDLLIQRWLQALVMASIPQAPLYYYGSGALLGLALLVLLGITPIIQLSRIPVAHLLRGDAPPSDNRARALTLISALLLIAVLMLYLQAPLAALIVAALLLVGGTLFGFITQWLMQRLSRPLARLMPLGRLLQMRLRQQRRWHRLQAAVIVLLLTLLSVVWIARTDLLESWQARFPASTPNYFLINIQPFQKAGVDKFLADNQIDARLFPMIRGRLSQLNGKPIRPQMKPEALSYNALNRELNLTWSRQMPAHNTLTAGQWWPPEGDKGEISLSTGMMSNLGLKLGDTLGFDIGGQMLTATITSVREVDWNSFSPNFYVIFSPGALENFPATWITSFKLGDDQRHLATELLKQYPTLTLIDIAALLDQVESWLKRLGSSSALILLITLGCGLILLIVTLLQTLEIRRFEGALLQTLGASARATRRLDLLEFLLLGIIGGLLAATGSELALAGLNLQLLDTPARFHLQLWITLPVAAVVLFCVIGFLIRRPLPLERCYQLLRSD